MSIGIQYTYFKGQPNDYIIISGHSITTWTGRGGGEFSVESLRGSREKG